MVMNSYVADELSNKVYHLHKALEKAQKIIAVLEEENANLKKLVNYLDNNKIQPVAA